MPVLISIYSMMWQVICKLHMSPSDKKSCRVSDIQVTFTALGPLFKRLAYTLTTYCYGSKYVTQPDASSKRYLWDKILC